MLRTTTSTSVLAALTVAFGATTALAQSSPAGNPADPNTTQNQQPGPSGHNPSDPAAGADPAARAPTAPPAASAPSSDGMGAGDMGFESPAGNPADPNTNENQQPGMSGTNPADPAAGSDPSARVPTDSTAD